MTQAHLTMLVCLYLLFVPLCAKKQIPKSSSCYFHCQQSHSKGRIFSRGSQGREFGEGKAAELPSFTGGAALAPSTWNWHFGKGCGAWSLISGISHLSHLSECLGWSRRSSCRAAVPTGDIPWKSQGHRAEPGQSQAGLGVSLLTLLPPPPGDPEPPRGYKPSSLSSSPSLSAS